MSSKLEFVVEKNDEKKRLDVFLAEKIENSRSFIKNSILEGQVLVNGFCAKPNYRLKQNDKITVNIIEMPKPSAAPEDIPLDIVYEDEDIIVINKPRGMVVYPAAGNYSGTLVNALLYHTKDLASNGGQIRPGIVHRLDKDTSGLIVVAKNNAAHLNLVEQLKNRQFKKVYQAIVWGDIKDNEGTIDAPIGRHPVRRKEMTVTAKNSKDAITHFKVVERFGEFTFIEARIETGRTHQIRVHMKFINHPIVADPVYSRKKAPFEIKGQALHAYKLGFYHPTTKKFIEFSAPMPDDMAKILDILRDKYAEQRKDGN